MARIYPLFSSSKGNCTYIGSKTEGILIDCGASFTRIKNALDLNGIDINTAVKGVFITHEHHDHVCGLKMLTKKCKIPVFAQSYTLDILHSEGMVLSYSEEFIRLSCGRRIVSFIGTGLELRCLSSSTAVVTGTIWEIRYEG